MVSAVEKIKAEKENGNISMGDGSGQRGSHCEGDMQQNLKEKTDEVFLHLQKEYSR